MKRKTRRSAHFPAFNICAGNLSSLFQKELSIFAGKGADQFFSPFTPPRVNTKTFHLSSPRQKADARVHTSLSHYFLCCDKKKLLRVPPPLRQLSLHVGEYKFSLCMRRWRYMSRQPLSAEEGGRKGPTRTQGTGLPEKEVCNVLYTLYRNICLQKY